VTLRGRKLKITLTSKGRACMDDGLTLKQLVLREIENRPKGFVSELVAISCYSNWQNLKRVLTKHEKEFDKLQCLIDMVEYIWKDDVVRLMTEYSTQIDPNKRTARFLLEYLSTNRQLEAFKSLLDKMSKCSNKESKEFAKVYLLQYEAQNTYPNADIDNLLRKTKLMRTTSNELIVFKKLFKTYCYHQKGDFLMCKSLADEIEYDLHHLEDDYVKTMFNARLCEAMSYINLRIFNNPVEARRYTDYVLSSEIGISFKAYANFVKGYSYFFTSYEDSLCYFSESISMYKELQRDIIVKDIEEKVELLKINWNKLDNGQCKFIANYLLYNLKRGVKISKLLNECQKDIDEAFFLYLKGREERDVEVLFRSLLKYVKKGDSFLANMPKRELIKLGLKEEILDETINIRSM
jgi:hypothetical protein